MKILQSKVSAYSTGYEIKKTTRTESLTISSLQRIQPINLLNAQPDIINISNNTFNTNNAPSVKSCSCEETIRSDDKNELKLALLELFIENMTGKKVKLNRVKNIIQNNFTQGESFKTRQLDFQLPMFDYRLTEQHYESQSMTYSAKALVQTEDGTRFDVSIEITMSRHFSSYLNLHMQNGKQVDPLVIQFGNGPLSLTGQKYSFDLDMDGTQDSISFVSPTAGFLVLDKNGDGKINDGSELFGPSSGNGFTELATYDNDSNGWIDENDNVFALLRIWTKDADGTDKLSSLSELDIGAIYLGEVKTPYTFKTADNSTQGYMRSSSFFLRENGSGGVVSHIDLVV